MVFVATKYKDICNISTGSFNTQDKEDGGVYDFYVRSPKVEKINKYNHDGPAILTAGDGVGVGKVFHYASGKIGVHQRVYILDSFKIINPVYLYYHFSSLFYNRVRKISAKNSVDSVRYEMISNMQITFPSDTEEMQKVAGLLSIVDKRIETQNKIIKEQNSHIFSLCF